MSAERAYYPDQPDDPAAKAEAILNANDVIRAATEIITLCMAELLIDQAEHMQPEGNTAITTEAIYLTTMDAMASEMAAEFMEDVRQDNSAPDGYYSTGIGDQADQYVQAATGTLPKAGRQDLERQRAAGSQTAEAILSDTNKHLPDF